MQSRIILSSNKRWRHQSEIVSVEYLDDLEAQFEAYEEMNADRFAIGKDMELPF